MTEQRGAEASFGTWKGGPHWVPGRFPEKAHVITDIKLTYGQQYVDCSCGYHGTRNPGEPTIEDIWAVHLGREYRPAVYRPGQIASDSEVGEFLGKLADPFYVAPLLKSQSYTPRVSDYERARDAMYVIVEMGLRCTCEGNKPSRDCPNFIEGDDQ